MHEIPNNMYISEIINQRQKCFFISPHLDDAIYSAGGLMNHLVKNHVPVTLITVFTSGHEPSSLSAKKFLYLCGYKTSDQLFSDRIKEDKEAAKSIKVKSIHLGYEDALWRKKSNLNFTIKKLSKILPEVINVYPTHRFHVGRGQISPEDNQIKISILNDITKIIGSTLNTSVFAPLALGKHVDHVLVRELAGRLNMKTVYWADFPYSQNYSDQKKFIEEYNLHKFVFPEFDTKLKEKLIKMYKSQFNAIFPKGKLVIPPETYFYSKI